MPDRPGIHGKNRPGTSLVVPKPKKPTPDNDMDYDFDSPAESTTPKKKEKKKKEKKKKNRRGLLQVNRTMTDREWADIARSAGKVGSRRIGGHATYRYGTTRPGKRGYRARKNLQRNRATYPVGSRWWMR